MKNSKILAIAAAFAICGCEKTIYPPGFVAARFSEVQTGWSVARVIETLGEPLRIAAYSTDPRNHPLPGNQQHEVILLKNAEKRGLDPHVFLLLEYSLQADATTDYWRYDMTIQRGVVTSIGRQLITE